METIKWLNENAGLIMAILTFVYVLATIFLAYIAWKTSKISIEAKKLSEESKDISRKALEISQKHLEQTSELEKQRIRPYVLFSIFFENGKTFASVKNYGLTAAFNIKVLIQPKLFRAFSNENKKENEESVITKKEITYLPPKYEFKDFIGVPFRIFEEYQEAVFEGKVSFENSEKVKFEETFYINLDNLKNAIPSDEISLSKSLEKTSKSSDKIASKLHNIEILLSSLFEKQSKHHKRMLRKNFRRKK